jgi:hypothetical protein
MAYRIILRRDTSVNWIQNNPVLLEGEPGYEIDTERIKIGDGQSPWSALPYYAGITGANRIPKTLTDEITVLLQSDGDKILYPMGDNRTVLVEDGFDFNSNNNRYIIDTTWNANSCILKLATNGYDYKAPNGSLTYINPSSGTPYFLDCPPNTITIFGRTEYSDNVVITQQVCNPINGKKVRTRNVVLGATGPDDFIRLNNDDKYFIIHPRASYTGGPVRVFDIVMDVFSDIYFTEGDEFTIDTRYYQEDCQLKLSRTDFEYSLPGIEGASSVPEDPGYILIDLPKNSVTKLKVFLADMIILVTQEFIRAYKAYMFKLDRSTGVPISSQDYENTIGPMSLTNGPTGTVKATLAGAFPTNKVIIFTQGVPASPAFSSTVNDINFSGSTDNFIEIRVYN